MSLRKIQRSLVLALISVVVLGLFFLMPFNRLWMEKKVLYYARSIPPQMKKTDEEQRKITRYAQSYALSNLIATAIEGKGKKYSALVLMPPASYFEKYGMKYPVPEPAVFYYFTGLKTIWATSPQATSASWVVGIDGGALAIIEIRDPKVLADSIRAFQAFKYKL